VRFRIPCAGIDSDGPLGLRSDGDDQHPLHNLSQAQMCSGVHSRRHHPFTILPSSWKLLPSLRAVHRFRFETQPSSTWLCTTTWCFHIHLVVSPKWDWGINLMMTKCLARSST